MQDESPWCGEGEEEGGSPAVLRSEGDSPPVVRAALLQSVALGREVGSADCAGSWLAAGAGRAVRTWRWACEGGDRGEGGGGWREVAAEVRAHRMAVRALRWARAGALLASGGAEGAVRLWARGLAARGELAAAGVGGVRALCWAGGGRLLAAHDCGAVCVWAPAGGGRLLARLRGEGGALHALAAPAAGALLLTGCGEGTLRLHDLEAVVAAGVDGSPPPPLAQVDGAHDLGVLCAAARDGGRDMVATGGQDARVRVWHAGQGGLEPAGELAGHGGAVTALAWVGDLLVSAGAEGAVRVWWARVVDVQTPMTPVVLLVVRAHARYCTCVAADCRLRYIVTGSNDRSLRTWSLGALSLSDELEPPCAALNHFALGDLQGIGAVDEEAGEMEELVQEARCLWSDDEKGDGGDEARHGGAINCIATHGDRVATACSDGMLRIYQWIVAEAEDTDEANATASVGAGEGSGRLVLTLSVRAHAYPACSVQWGAGGALLITAGLDGYARLWDPDSGAELGALGEGGCGVRGTALREGEGGEALVALAADGGPAPAGVWPLRGGGEPLHVFEGHEEGAMCCGWARGGALLAVGGAGGELRLHAPPPSARLVHLQPDAHDLGVQTLQWLDTPVDAPEEMQLLVSGGSDGFVKMWAVHYREDDEEAVVRLAWSAWAHEGGVSVVRGARGGELVVSGGADRWARVWRVGGAGGEGGGGALRALPAPGRQLTALDELREVGGGGLLALGSLDGRLAVWRLGDDGGGGEDETEEVSGPRGWGSGGAARWLQAHGCMAAAARALSGHVTGGALLDLPLDRLLQLLTDQNESDDENDDEAARAHLRNELRWLRAAPPPEGLSELAPHGLLCPLTHRLMTSPVRAADGCSYERTALHEWMLAEGAVSPVSGNPLRARGWSRNARLCDTLRAFLTHHGAAPSDEL